SDASLIANYDVKRCYEVDITFHYEIQGGLTSSTISNTRRTFSGLLSGISTILSTLPACSSVTVTRKDIINSLPGVRSVFFRIPLIFTASTSVPDYEVSKKLFDCISTLSAYKQFLDSNTPKIKQGDMTYSTYNLSSISNTTSCCGGDIPPPCCAVGSIRINSTKCGDFDSHPLVRSEPTLLHQETFSGGSKTRIERMMKVELTLTSNRQLKKIQRNLKALNFGVSSIQCCLPGFKFVPDSLCVRCPSDTYQNNQGQRSCEKCPAKKQTFGKTGMTSESNCSDTNPLQLSDQVVYLPYDIKSETLVTNVTVTGRLESLVQPLLFYMENVTQQQLSRSESKRKRRDIDDFCEDSDQWGKTENTAKIRFIPRDLCWNLRAIYDVAVKNCLNNSSSVTRQNWCLSERCVKFCHRWKEALINTSRVTLQTNCSFDPHNLAAVMREHPSCPSDI
ncbi:unnamed protein product, partial [Pocillopora meandrina]